MPAWNGTGPMGMGPMTGWGRGRCGRGMGMGGGFARFGMGRGFGGVWAAPAQQQETDERYLRQEMEMLKARMEDIQTRLGKVSGE